MNNETPPERLLFVDNLKRGFLSFGLLGSFFGIIIYTASTSPLDYCKVQPSPLDYNLTSAVYALVYSSKNKRRGEGKQYSPIVRKVEQVAKLSTLEWAVLLPLSSLLGATLFSIAYPNVPLGVLLVVASSAVWGYAHTRSYTPVYTPIANPKGTISFSRMIYQKWHGGA